MYDRCGDAIWRSRSRRTVTNSQWQTLLTDYGGCFHCGAPPAICQAHHIIPYSQGGETSVNNMVMVCWNCHHKIHHHNWHIQTHTNGHHTLHPPNNNPALQPRYGPAHAANQQQPAPEPPPHPKRSPTQTKTSRTSRTRTKARDPAKSTRTRARGKPKTKKRTSSLASQRRHKDSNTKNSGPAARTGGRSSSARDPASSKENQEERSKIARDDLAPATLW